MMMMMTIMKEWKSVSCRRYRKIHRFKNCCIASLLLGLIIILAIMDNVIVVESSFSSSFRMTRKNYRQYHHNVAVLARQGQAPRGQQLLVVAGSSTCLWRSRDTISLPMVNDNDELENDDMETIMRNKHHSSCLPAVAKTTTTTAATTSSSSRRQTLQTMMIMPSVAAASALATSWQLPLVQPANAAAAAAADATATTATADNGVKPSIVPAVEVLQRLRQVPVYAIVDGVGIPFMTYDSESAGANGYFFLDYTNAQGVLEDAKRAYASAKENKVDGVSDTWGDSRIVTLPLDLAMRLTVKQVSNVAQNDKSFRTIYQVLPSAVRSSTFDMLAFIFVDRQQQCVSFCVDMQQQCVGT
jgi:Tic22-like family